MPQGGSVFSSSDQSPVAAAIGDLVQASAQCNAARYAAPCSICLCILSACRDNSRASSELLTLINSAQDKPKAASRWKRRYTIVALCFVAFMLCNMDRVNMSIAILPMAKQYAWDSQTIGLVQSSFFWCARQIAQPETSAENQ